MRAGNLKHLIEIEKYTTSKSGIGSELKTWSLYAEARASITPLSAKEFFKAGINAEATHKVEIRYIAGVLPKMRIVFGERVFQIESVLNVREQNRSLAMICTEDV